MLTFEVPSLSLGAGWAVPPVFQQKPDTQLFFLRKTLSSAKA
jgi:hypothetical protein